MQLMPTETPRRSRGLLSTRRGTLAVAGVLALLAGAALLVFLNEYREDVTSSDRVQVLVARSLVPKGTPGEVIADERLYRLARVENSELQEDALTDPAELAGKAVARDITPGQQLTNADFESGRAAQARLGAFQRAMNVPLDPARGMIGNIEPGDRVDVLVTFQNTGADRRSARVAAENVLVLAVPDDPDTGGVAAENEQAATLRVSEDAVPTIAAAVDAGEVWLVLRPAVGAGSTTPSGGGG